jgi:Domain of unknown function (DUF5664)
MTDRKPANFEVVEVPEPEPACDCGPREVCDICGISYDPFGIRDSKPLDPKGEAGSKKCPLHLIPASAMEETAYVHKLGSDKYGEFNWRKTGVSANTYIAAIMRHLNAFREGEDLDPESGRSHIAHIAANANILLDAAACDTLVDDRNKKPN